MERHLYHIRFICPYIYVHDGVKESKHGEAEI